MIDPIREKARLLLLVVAASALGVGLARGIERRGAGEQPALPAVGATTRGPQPAPGEAALSSAFVSVAEAVVPAVVRIQAERTPRQPARGTPRGLRDFFGTPPGDDAAPDHGAVAGGSGFLVSPDGYILTSNHVIEGADRIRVTLVDKRSFEAEVVGTDRTTDVALLRIPARGLPALRLGDSDAARVGEWVLAIGNPGFEQASTLDFTVTSGIIGAKGRPLHIINRELAAHDDMAAGLAIEDFIQTDAVINPGNSGGPLVNLRGEVIGVTTAIASPTGYYQGYGFAIPSNLARRVMEDLLQHGRVRRALLGIAIADVDEEDAEAFGLSEISGVVVEDFTPGSPAERSGLARGDVIVSVDGRKVDRVGQLQRLIALHEPGDVVELGVIRYGSPHRFEVRLMEAEIPGRPAAAAPRGARRAAGGLGIEFDDLTAELAREFGHARAGGVIVVGVEPSSPAERKGVQPGQRVLAVDRRPVASAREAEAMVRAVGSGGVVSLLLESPQGRTHIANLRVP
ncbi:MAG TPA: trypsin-like peptidase domain-containing protein [Longimicrobiales bacterium]